MSFGSPCCTCCNQLAGKEGSKGESWEHGGVWFLRLALEACKQEYGNAFF